MKHPDTDVKKKTPKNKEITPPQKKTKQKTQSDNYNQKWAF